MDNDSNRYNGHGFVGMLALVFITLKLCGVINWSWWWVLAPVWIPTGIVLAVIGVCAVLFLISALINRP